MHYFLDAYWQRGGRADGSVTLLRHAPGPIRDPDNEDALLTTDPAFWDDWWAAIDKARSDSIPTTL